MTTVQDRNEPNGKIQVIRKNDESEVMDAGPIKLRVLEDGSNTDQRLGCVEITTAPRTPGPPQHWHQMHDETFLVISGEYTFTSRNEKVVLGPGDFLVVPPMAPHTFANEGDVPAVMFNTFTPSYYVHYFRVMRGMMAEAGKTKQPVTPEISRNAMLRYATLQTKDMGFDW